MNRTDFFSLFPLLRRINRIYPNRRTNSCTEIPHWLTLWGSSGGNDQFQCELLVKILSRNKTKQKQHPPLKHFPLCLPFYGTTLHIGERQRKPTLEWSRSAILAIRAAFFCKFPEMVREFPLNWFPRWTRKVHTASDVTHKFVGDKITCPVKLISVYLLLM